MNPLRIFSLSALLAVLAAPAPAQRSRDTGAAPGSVTMPQAPTGTLVEPGIDRTLFRDAARVAWSYIDGQTQPATGLVNSVKDYPYATVWDIGSGILAMHAANRLGLLPDAEYERRMRLTLGTLAEMRLFDDAAFNKNYATRTGAIAGRNGSEAKDAQRGYGWSALDVGRLLVALRVVADNDPRLRSDVERVVGRLKLDRLVEGGYLRGEDLSPETGRKRRYQEGRIGYEQYAALGYAAWGRPAERASRLAENTYPISVMGVPLVADRRGGRLTSEPFLLIGLETGWTPEVRELAWRLLAAQEARYRRTGKVTIASEDALNRAPYFLYYSVYADGKEFPVEPPDGAPPGPTPRTVSTKAAFGWHALLPSAYTWLAVQTVANAKTPAGWGAGVFEDGGRISGAENVNTAAIVLEAALYAARGRPLLVRPDSASGR